MRLTVFEWVGNGRFAGSDAVLGGNAELVFHFRFQVFNAVVGRLHLSVQIHSLRTKQQNESIKK